MRTHTHFVSFIWNFIFVIDSIRHNTTPKKKQNVLSVVMGNRGIYFSGVNKH